MVRPIPPMKAATLVPTANSPPGHALTSPTHSMPLTNAASAQSPFLIWVSALFMPNALTSISTEPGCGTGSGNFSMTRLSTPPKPLMMIARIRNPLVARFDVLDREYREITVPNPHQRLLGRARIRRRGSWLDECFRGHDFAYPPAGTEIRKCENSDVDTSNRWGGLTR